MAASNDRSAKDKQMAARLKAAGDDRHTGVCCICYRIISNGPACEAHYGRHARGSDAD